MPTIKFTGTPTEDEAAAMLAVIACLLGQEAPVQSTQPPARPAWRAAALLESQGHAASFGGNDATWGGIARTNRSRRWSKGIVGS